MSNDNSTAESAAKTSNFIHQIIEDDLKSADAPKQIVTRFPPEPNGYLHIGHAKSICLNFGTAEKFNGVCNLRFDDTNPEKESQEYIEAIKRDIRWLGFTWHEDVRYTSSYFDQLYNWAVYLIEKGNAYVCDLNAEQARAYRGDFTTPGKNSPYRDRSISENLTLFAKMKAGGFAEGFCSLRAKIDMQSSNMNLRDPMLYRILNVSHHQTGDQWCIYPIYDFAHGQSDAIEGITHSICTLEFEGHRPLYEWFLEHLPVASTPRQYEFSRLELNYTVTSKRKLKQLVDKGIVNGWDDPRMPTISGMRRRGYTATAIRKFCDMVGVTRSNGVVDVGMLESAVREDLEVNAKRAMCVIDPLKVTLSNVAEGASEMLSLAVHPKLDMGERELPFSKYLYIEKQDFSEDTSLGRKKFKRLVIGDYVRLRGAYVIKAEQVIKDDSGQIIEVIASIVPGTVGANPAPEFKPRGVIHWVSACHAVPCELRIYDRLFSDATPDKNKEKPFTELINPDSLQVIPRAWAEPSLLKAEIESGYQFERTGYFVADADSTPEQLVFNQTLPLRESKAK
ncbi:MAG: glutamine--tRNA ligase/YqeY domain fusion protein [Oceanospirillaceae bacterium]|nr:glutamine--tRNA ligase/YqeY domain fusion protein [Oceanospirillaceae bacterium]